MVEATFGGNTCDAFSVSGGKEEVDFEGQGLKSEWKNGQNGCV